MPVRSAAAETTPQILRPELLIMGRLVWAAVFAVSLVTFGASLPALWAQLQSPASDVNAGLTQLGIAAEGYALYKFAAQMLTSVMFYAMSVFILWRLSQLRFGLMTAIFFAAMGTPLGGGAPTLSLALGGTFFPTLMYVLGWWSVWLFAATFPDGRVLPRWAAVPALVGIVTLPFWLFPPASPLLITNWSPALQVAVMLATYGGTLAARIHRFRLLASPVQRQQAKWIVFVFALVGVVSVLNHLVPPLVQGVGSPGVQALLFDFAQTLPALLSGFVPVALMLAMVRYRLWDIDLIINRSLVYGAAALLLLVVFGASAAALSSLAGAPVSGWTLLVLTVGVGILFKPTRRRMQSFIDRRLYRFRHDLDAIAAAQKPPPITTAGALTGTTLAGYDVMGLLGKGGMGEVYAGYLDGQTVALKILLPALATQPDFVRRFQHEAAAMERLAHPHIVRLIAAGSENALHYLVLEYIDGIDLSVYLRQHGQFAPGDAIRLLVPLAQALDCVHRQGMVHRDVKPGNIMLRQGELTEVVLMDFGLAKLPDEAAPATGADGDGDAIGTIDYMAPEQILAADVDQRADVYALGVLSYQLVTGQTPFQGNVGQVVFAHLQQPAPDPCALNPALSWQMGDAIQRAMAKSPDARYESADAFVRALLADVEAVTPAPHAPG